MAIVFAVRGDSFDARYSNGGKTGTRTSTTLITLAADAAAIGGNVIDLNTAASGKSLHWNAGLNTPNGREISFNLGIVARYSGSPANRRILFSLSTASSRLGCIEVAHETSGNISVYVTNETSATPVNVVSAGAWNPTSGTRYDISLAWNGTSSANSLSVYIDGVLLGSITPSAAMSASWTNRHFKEICVGAGSNSVLALIAYDEIVIWDTVIDFTGNVTLTSGAGLLNGASRTAFVDVAAFDGLSWTTLSADKIKLNEVQTQAGVQVTGTYAPSGGGQKAKIMGGFY